MKACFRRYFVVSVCLACSGIVAGQGRAADENIPWKSNEIYNRNIVDEDITTLLRDVMRRNGTRLVLSPEVSGRTTFNFSNFPLQGVFNFVVTEHELDFTYDSATNTITVSDPSHSAATPAKVEKNSSEKMMSVEKSVIENAQREISRQIAKEKLEQKIAEVQVRQFEELEKQKVAIMSAEAEVRRLANGNAAFEDQLRAIYEAKRQAQAYLDMQTRHQSELRAVRARDSKPLAMAPIAAQPYVSDIKKLKQSHEADVASLKARIRDLSSSKDRAEAKARRDQAEQERRIATLSTKIDEQEIELEKAWTSSTKLSKEFSDKIAALEREMLESEQQRDKALQETKRLAQKHEEKKVALEKSLVRIRQAQTQSEKEAEVLKKRFSAQKQKYLQEMEQARHAREAVDSLARIAADKRAHREQQLMNELAAVQQSQRNKELKSRVETEQRMQAEEILRRELEELRRANREAEMRSTLESARRSQTEMKLKAELARMRKVQESGEIQIKIDAEKQALKERALKAELQQLQKSLDRTKIEDEIQAEKYEQLEKRLNAELAAERQASRNTELAAELNLKKQQSLITKLRAELRRQKHYRKVSEIESQRKTLDLAEMEQRLKSENAVRLSDKNEEAEARLVARTHPQALERQTTDPEKATQNVNPFGVAKGIATATETAGEAVTNPRKQEVDATWLFKLSGIGRSGDTRYATIDGKDYKIGDSLKGMEIVQISRRQVVCVKETVDGRLRYLIGFRR